MNNYTVLTPLLQGKEPDEKNKCVSSAFNNPKLLSSSLHIKCIKF